MSRLIRAGLAGAIEGASRILVLFYAIWAVKLGLIDSNIHPVFAIVMIALSTYGLWVASDRVTRHVTRIVSGEANDLSADDAVRVKTGSPPGMRPGRKARVVGIVPYERRVGPHVPKSPRGTVYLVEFDDGELLDVHEDMLERVDR